MQYLIDKILPILVLLGTIGIFVLAVILSLYILYYVALVGLLIFAFTWVRKRLFPSSPEIAPPSAGKQEEGRIIDHDDPKN